MNNIDNPLSGYQSPPEEALRNFGIDISREVVEKYGIKVYAILAQYVIDNYNALIQKMHPICCNTCQ